MGVYRFDKSTVCLALAVTISLLLPSMISAAPILPGYDLYGPGNGVVPLNIGSDFFRPGSDPMSSSVFRVFSKGVIFQRQDGLAPFNVGDSGIVAVSVPLFHLSDDGGPPVTYGGMNPEYWFHFMDLAPGPQPGGTFTIRRTMPTGGTFDGDVTINGRFRFVSANDGTERFLDRTLQLTWTNATWSSTPPPHDQHTAAMPAGDFYVTGVMHGFFQPNNSGILDVSAAIPEPGTGLCWGVGWLLLLRRRCR